jgi:uncharacterized damage-inducible protein DinB
MLHEVERLCDRLEQSRARVLGLVEATDQRRRSVQPADGKWSMLQVVEHLVLAEEGTLRVFEQGPPPQPKVKVRSVLVLRAIEGLFGMRLRLPVPSKSLTPTVPESLEALRLRWTTASDGITQCVGALESDDLRQPRFRHPLAGWVTVGHGLDFLERHVRHHQRQVHRIRRLLDAAHRPGA